MEADFNSINSCSQQLRKIAVRLRRKIDQAEELKMGIAQQSGTDGVIRLMSAAGGEMENESFLLLEMSNMLEDILRLYTQTENEVQRTTGGLIFKARAIVMQTLYSGNNTSDEFKEYFKL